MLRWVIFHLLRTLNSLSSHLFKFFRFFVYLLDGWLGYELSRFNFGLTSLFIFISTVSSGSVWFIPYFSAHGVPLSPFLLGYYSLRISDLGWAQCLAEQVTY
jgi:hypothetical protein